MKHSSDTSTGNDADLKSGFYGIFNDSYPPILDGVTLTVENYVRWLMAKGRTPCVVTPSNPVRDESACEVLRYFSLPIRSRKPYRYGYPKLDPFIWKRLRSTDFRLVHAHCPFSSGRLAVYVKEKLHVPLIGTFHSKYRDDLMHSLKHFPWMVDSVMERILDFFNSCDEVWIPQAQVEETVREYGFKGPLTVVENGNDMASMVKGGLQEYKLAAKRELGIPEGRLSLLFVGQHIWEKGLDIVVESLRQLGDEIDFCMNFIGTGYAAEEIARRVASYGLSDRVTFHGVISDRKVLSCYYAAADLFLFPSFYDNVDGNSGNSASRIDGLGSCERRAKRVPCREKRIGARRGCEESCRRPRQDQECRSVGKRYPCQKLGECGGGGYRPLRHSDFFLV